MDVRGVHARRVDVAARETQEAQRAACRIDSLRLHAPSMHVGQVVRDLDGERPRRGAHGQIIGISGAVLDRLVAARPFEEIQHRLPERNARLAPVDDHLRHLEAATLEAGDRKLADRQLDVVVDHLFNIHG